MEKMTYKEYNNALKTIGISYLGKFDTSAKLALNGKAGVITYCLYLAPWKLAAGNGLNINVCPAGKNCAPFCLNASGHNKSDILARGVEGSRINRARIKKTRLFYTDRVLFMRMLCYELEKTRAYAERRNMDFSVRLNCTSDLSPLAFVLCGKNILDMYPDVQFYDYTKVPSRLEIPSMYKNYDLTFSFDGYNLDTCIDALRKGINIAVVFESQVPPIAWNGYPVIDMTKTDLRYKDAKGGFVGYLEYHRTANDYVNGKYVRPNTPFVVKEDDPYITYAFKTPKSTEIGE